MAFCFREGPGSFCMSHMGPGHRPLRHTHWPTPHTTHEFPDKKSMSFFFSKFLCLGLLAPRSGRDSSPTSITATVGSVGLTARRTLSNDGRHCHHPRSVRRALPLSVTHRPSHRLPPNGLIILATLLSAYCFLVSLFARQRLRIFCVLGSLTANDCL